MPALCVKTKCGPQKTSRKTKKLLKPLKAKKIEVTQARTNKSKIRKKHFLKLKQVLSPVESPICWLDKSFLRTRLISLVSKDNLATNEQLSLSFSKYIHFKNKCYEGVDPTLDPNAYLRS